MSSLLNFSSVLAHCPFHPSLMNPCMKLPMYSKYSLFSDSHGINLTTINDHVFLFPTLSKFIHFHIRIYISRTQRNILSLQWREGKVQIFKGCAFDEEILFNMSLSFSIKIPLVIISNYDLDTACTVSAFCC